MEPRADEIKNNFLSEIETQRLRSQSQLVMVEALFKAYRESFVSSHHQLTASVTGELQTEIQLLENRIRDTETARSERLNEIQCMMMKKSEFGGFKEKRDERKIELKAILEKKLDEVKNQATIIAGKEVEISFLKKKVVDGEGYVAVEGPGTPDGASKIKGGYRVHTQYFKP